MAITTHKRGRAEEDARRPKKKPKFRKQVDYYSSSEDEGTKLERRLARVAPKSILKQSAPAPKESPPEAALEDGDALEQNTALNAMKADESGEEESGTGEEEQPGGEYEDDDSADSDAGASSLGSSSTVRMAKKRNDPDAFATSISKILGTKLSQPKREDPILSRSKDSSKATQELADLKLEHRARAILRAEKKQSLEKGRVKDVLALESAEKDTGALQEEEKRLKKTAQRGVVRLFNAVRAAQVKAEEAFKQAKGEGIVGIQKREERVNEMSKQGFLDLISQGGTAKASS